MVISIEFRASGCRVRVQKICVIIYLHGWPLALPKLSTPECQLGHFCTRVFRKVICNTGIYDRCDTCKFKPLFGLNGSKPDTNAYIRAFFMAGSHDCFRVVEQRYIN